MAYQLIRNKCGDHKILATVGYRLTDYSRTSISIKASHNVISDPLEPTNTIPI